MNANQFLKSLETLTFPDTFNPYVHRCPVYDRVDAPNLRRRMLLSILKEATRSEIDSIWIGRDLGYRGGRRTGLALTDDVYMQAHAQRWGVKALRPTHGEPVAERTAAVIWGLLARIGDPIFLWNVFPLHPHAPSSPFSNRSHSAAERRAGEDVLSELIDLLKPRRLVAIGNDAAASARKLSRNSNVEQVRHPSYGGQSQFLETMHDLYRLAPKTGQLGMF